MKTLLATAGLLMGAFVLPLAAMPLIKHLQQLRP
jgi:hypothetical protein